MIPLPPRYQPTGQTFDGGMSDVIVCTDTHLSRLVVVKSLKPGADARRILDELRALQTIRSKHVVQIYDVIKNNKGEVVAIVEEYLPGKDLTSVPKPTDSKEFLRLAYAIAEGISDIHAHNRVHRDVKRQNMKFDGEDCLKLFDFGLARDDVDASTMGQLGTPGYMAPELFEATAGGTVNFTPAVDTFAFAATLLAILLGRPPKDLRQSPPKLPSADADFTNVSIPLPTPIAEILNACLERSISSRPSMNDVTQLIGSYLLQGQHRALIVNGPNTYVLDTNNAVVNLAVAGQGSLTITYDGLGFVVSNVGGDVAINNSAANPNGLLPGSCVIVLGAQALGAQRTIVTVDVSHPEVTL